MIDRRTPKERREDAYANQALEGNPLTDEEKAESEQWEREGLSTEECIARIIATIKTKPAK